MKYILVFLLSLCSCGDGTHTFYMGGRNNKPVEIELTKQSFFIFNKRMGCEAATLEIEEYNYVFVNTSDIYEQIDFVAKPECDEDCEGVTMYQPYSDIQIRENPFLNEQSFGLYQRMYIYTIIHELGHVFGLDHTSDPKDIMYKYLNYNDINEDSWDRFKKQILTKNLKLCTK